MKVLFVFLLSVVFLWSSQTQAQSPRQLAAEELRNFIKKGNSNVKQAQPQYGGQQYYQCVNNIQQKILYRGQNNQNDSCESAFYLFQTSSYNQASQLAKSAQTSSQMTEHAGTTKNVLATQARSAQATVNYCRKVAKQVLDHCRNIMRKVDQQKNSICLDATCFQSFEVHSNQARTIMKATEKYITAVTGRLEMQARTDANSSAVAANTEKALHGGDLNNGQQQAVANQAPVTNGAAPPPEEESGLGKIFNSDNLKTAAMLGIAGVALHQLMKNDDKEDDGPVGKCTKDAQSSMSACHKKMNVVLAYHDRRKRISESEKADELGELDPEYGYKKVKEVCTESLNTCEKSCLTDVKAEDYLKTQPIYNSCKEMKHTIDDFHKKAIAAGEVEPTDEEIEKGIDVSGDVCLKEGGEKNPNCSKYYMSKICTNFSNEKCKTFVDSFCIQNGEGGVPRGQGFVFCEMAQSYNYCHSAKSKGESLSCHWVYNRNQACSEDVNSEGCLPSFGGIQIETSCAKFSDDPLCARFKAAVVAQSQPSGFGPSQKVAAASTGTQRHPTQYQKSTGTTQGNGIAWQSVLSHTKAPIQKACREGQLKDCR